MEFWIGFWLWARWESLFCDEIMTSSFRRWGCSLARLGNCQRWLPKQAATNTGDDSIEMKSQRAVDKTSRYMRADLDQRYSFLFGWMSTTAVSLASTRHVKFASMPDPDILQIENQSIISIYTTGPRCAHDYHLIFISRCGEQNPSGSHQVASFPLSCMLP